MVWQELKEDTYKNVTVILFVEDDKMLNWVEVYI